MAPHFYSALAPCEARDASLHVRPVAAGAEHLMGESRLECHSLGLEQQPLVFAQAEPGIRERYGAFIAGADDYLMKPFTSLQIDEKLAQAGLTRHLLS